MVPITTGRLDIFNGKETVPANLVTGLSYNRQVGVKHDVINNNDFEFVFIEVEVKP